MSIESLKKAQNVYVADMSKLYDERKRPIYSNEIQGAKEAAALAKFVESVEGIVALAKTQRRNAEAELAKANNPYQWLTSTELERAAVLKDFVREDIMSADAEGVLKMVRGAAVSDRPFAWVVMRYASQRWDELTNEDHLAVIGRGNDRLSLDVSTEFEKAMKKLREVVIPTSARMTAGDAERRIAEAEETIRTASQISWEREFKASRPLAIS